MNVTIKTSSSKLRDATSGRGRNSGGTIAVGGSQIAAGKPSRGTKRSYAESDSLDEDDDDDDEMEDLGDDDDDDAEGDEDDEDEDIDVDAEGDDDEEDADGDVDMDGPATAAPKTIKIHNPKANRSAPSRRAAAARVVDDEDDDDEEELSEIEVSDPENAGDMSINVGGRDEDDDEEDEEEDAEGEDDDMEDAGQDDEEDAEGELDVTAVGGADDLDSDEDGSRARTPDLTKMTRRQRARFEDEPQSYMKLSDGRCNTRYYPRMPTNDPQEVQAKKVFTAEELSMRRQEMARRRRNLSEKRNEEVKVSHDGRVLPSSPPFSPSTGFPSPAPNQRGH